LRSVLRSLACVALFFACHSAALAAGEQQLHAVTTNKKDFLLDGKPFQIFSGEMHYARIPREYWRDRLKKARAMGLNAITTYVFWNLHEPRLGVFDFSGQNDIAAFIRMAQEENLYVILRPGPYVCSEWDLGGLPAWLFADPTIVLRSTDPKFLAPAERYLMRVGQELAPLQYSRGGPIIAVQVENEYGSFDHDKSYMAAIRDTIRRAGLGEVLLYTADGPEELPDGTLPDLHAVVNFGPGEAQKAFSALQKFRPNQPLMAGEYWDGWFDAWGKPHNKTDGAKQAREIAWILDQGYSISLYMFHGGTSFGFMNGANATKEGYAAQTTSYDYDAALDEAGRPTQKYFAFREVLRKHQLAGSSPLPELPPATPIISIPEFQLERSAPLWGNLPAPIASEHPRGMESFGQSYGYILYRTVVHGPIHGALKLAELHDYAVIFLNQRPTGTLDRRLGQSEMQLNVPGGDVTLDILVENTGRINFAKVLRDERKGITQSVALGGNELTGWRIYPLPMESPSQLNYATGAQDGPAFYRGTFSLAKLGDTFLDTRGWGKGVVWINGHCLGRIWSIGPQQTLYLPAPWLREGENEVIVFDLITHTHHTLRGITKPVLNELHSPN
jgi:beta-galactosidase